MHLQRAENLTKRMKFSTEICPYELTPFSTSSVFSFYQTLVFGFFFFFFISFEKYIIMKYNTYNVRLIGALKHDGENKIYDYSYGVRLNMH